VPPLVSRIERLGALSPVCAPVSDADLTLTAAQAEQLVAFLQEKRHEGAVLLRGAKHLSAIEAVLLDEEGNETSAKRLLFSQ
jgi:hypothetical protein